MLADCSRASIGTHPDNTLVLDDPTVSRFHCTIERSPLGLLVRDLDSRNGVFVDGLRVREAVVPRVAHLTLGRTRVDLCCETEPVEDTTGFPELLGTSPAIQRVTDLLKRVAPSDATVLLQGETGTGKSLVARAIHRASQRSANPFVVVDLASLAPSLFESELFGHERGSFTGATVTRAGAFETADEGTLFLDEIGEIPPELQSKLLRAIEERRVKRIGAAGETAIDVRLIAATNRELREEVRAGRFRSDLFYRLDIVPVKIPPLRERREDVAILARHFARTLARPGERFEITDQEIAPLKDGFWPGNVRELRAAIERAIILRDRSSLRSQRPPPPDDTAHIRVPTWRPGQSFRTAKQHVVRAFEQRFVAQVLSQFSGNVSQAARTAKMDRNYLRTLIHRCSSD